MDKRRVLLILPPNVNVIEPFLSAKKKQLPLLLGFPLGLGYIASFLIQDGNYEVKIIDGNKDNLSISGICGIIRDFDPHYIGLTVYTINSKVAVQLAKMIKSEFKNKIVIAGGPHASDDYKSLFTRHNNFDYIVFGEGEITMLELLRAIDSKDRSKINGVKGIAYLDSNTHDIISTGERTIVRDIDVFPFPARELVDFDVYIHRNNLLPYAVEIMGSRGCSHRCVFCSFQKPWRARGVEHIIKEMKYLVTRYPRIRSFLFFDDNFSVDKKRVIDLCRAIIRERLDKYKWSCLCRADQVTEEMLLWMKRAGCIKIMYGVETADPGIMLNLNKKISLDQVKKSIELTTKIRIDALAFFIIGNPGETMKSIKDTFNFAKKLRCQSTVWSIMQIYPGTSLAELQPYGDFVSYVYEPEIEDPSDTLSANVPVFENPGLEREELKLIYKKIFRSISFYKAIHHPIFIIKKVFRTPGSALGFLSFLLRKSKIRRRIEY